MHYISQTFKEMSKSSELYINYGVSDLDACADDISWLSY